MRRADRLFEIVQLLRGQRLRTAQAIADRLEVSVRTIYRDIEALIATGVPIEGERGIGYVIRSHFVLPPLQFSTEELQAVVLGARFVRAWGDSALIQAAEEALVKIDAVLPKEIKGQIWRQDLTAHANVMTQAHRRTLADLRQALNRQLKVDLIYYDAKGDATARCVRPLSLDAWGHAWTLTAWCELRADFRVFRLDRIETAMVSEQGFRLEPGKTLNDFFTRLTAQGTPLGHAAADVDRFGKGSLIDSRYGWRRSRRGFEDTASQDIARGNSPKPKPAIGKRLARSRILRQ